ncbi:hypothetical protein QBC37DRAFT_381942 [Rhypophila decipiens]|uniref:GRF-type domain-containing protein n=1 Tax=Rhypophila decipiens TaxID=261697 RepID=A0AAN6YP35_9PEZI|nr:hypothetical protein QBC37DRAFT_381942 [Rhypophila decipiens]
MPFRNTRSRGGRNTTRTRAPAGTRVGVWKCECDPPLSAVRLQVKKKGKNRGRWFWSCPRPREVQCDFFAWDEDGSAAQEDNSSPSAIVTTIGQGAPPLPDLTPTPVRSRRFSNTSPSTTTPFANASSLFGRLNRTAPQVRIPRNTIIQNQIPNPSDSGDGLFVDDDFYDDGPIDFPHQPEEPITPPSLKRRRIKMENGDDEYFAIHQIPSQQRSASRGLSNLQNQPAPSRNSGRADETQEDLLGELDSDDARRLVQLTDSQTTTQKISQLERQEAALLGSQRALNPPSTPTQRQRPATTVGMGGLVTPNTRISDVGLTTGQRTTGYSSDISSSSQIRRSPSSSQLNDSGDYEITAKVMALLAGQPIPETVRANVRNTLNNYALRQRGVERGREMSRAALHARNARIGELQAQIASLQEKERLGKEKIRQLTASFQALAEDD